MQIRLGHSPDPDDAFMFCGLATGEVDPGPYRIEHVTEDIQTLNERATRGELEMTALSLHAYAHVSDRYRLTRCGGSFGRNYGPIIVARRKLDPAHLAGRTIAIPGKLTTAYLLLRLFAPARVNCRVVPFDRIIPAVAAGEADAGVIIHEGQLTYAAAGLQCVGDLGVWWEATTHLPLPLGVNAIRRDLPPPVASDLAGIFLASIRYGLDHRAEAVAYAMQFARDMESDLADKFIGMYVNDLTLDMGDTGQRGIEELLNRAAAAGVIPSRPEVEFV